MANLTPENVTWSIVALVGLVYAVRSVRRTAAEIAAERADGNDPDVVAVGWMRLRYSLAVALAMAGFLVLGIVSMMPLGLSLRPASVAAIFVAEIALVAMLVWNDHTRSYLAGKDEP